MSHAATVELGKLKLSQVKPSFPPTYWILVNQPQEPNDPTTGQNYIPVLGDGILWVSYSWSGEQPTESPYVSHNDGSTTRIAPGENYIEVNAFDAIVYYNTYTIKLVFQMVSDPTNPTPPTNCWLLEDDYADGITNIVVANAGTLWFFYEWATYYHQPPQNSPYVDHNGGGTTPIVGGENLINVGTGDTIVFYNEYNAKFGFQMI